MAQVLKKTENKAAPQSTEMAMAAVSGTVSATTVVSTRDDKAVIENLDLLMNFETLVSVDIWDELLYLADVPDTEAEAEVMEEGK